MSSQWIAAIMQCLRKAADSVDAYPKFAKYRASIFAIPVSVSSNRS